MNRKKSKPKFINQKRVKSTNLQKNTVKIQKLNKNEEKNKKKITTELQLNHFLSVIIHLYIDKQETYTFGTFSDHFGKKNENKYKKG